MKDFFKAPPEHAFKVGDLVTCDCHGGLAIIIKLYDDECSDVKMNMAKIWWIRKTYPSMEREWMHTIARLKPYG